jgi:hypothetical protein
VERTGTIDRKVMEQRVTPEDMELHFARVLEKAYDLHWKNAMRTYNRKKQVEEERRKKLEAKAAGMTCADSLRLASCHPRASHSGVL